MKTINLRNISILLRDLAIKFVFLSVFAIQSSYAVVQVLDAETEDVVRELISPILKQAGENPDTVNVYILLDDRINAFVAGGRNIFLNTGIISSFNDPDVLKGVVAHELGHISGGHLVRTDEKMRELRKQSWAAVSLVGLASILSGRPDALMSGIAGQSHLLSRDYLSYSRSQESAADQASIKYLHGSKNTLRGIIKLLEFFVKKETQYIQDVNPYAVTHPLSKTRLSTLKLALKNEPKGYGSSMEEKRKYERIVGKLRGFLQKSSLGDVVIEKDLDPIATKYEKTVILYEKHKVQDALVLINELLKQEPRNGYFYELKAQILLRGGKINEALESYKKSVEYVTNPLIPAEYGFTLINTADSVSKSEREKNIKLGIEMLDLSLAKGFSNPGIYRTLAAAYGKLGDFGYSNLMLAEEAMQQQKYSEARQFIKIADKYSKNQSRLKLKIEDIMNELDKPEEK